jgi:hypothetical protein
MERLNIKDYIFLFRPSAAIKLLCTLGGMFFAPLREPPLDSRPFPEVNLPFPVPIRFPRVETDTIHFPAPGALRGQIAA